MLILLSPSKTINWVEKQYNPSKATPIVFRYEVQELNAILRKLTYDQICTMMNISGTLAEKTYQNIHSFSKRFTTYNSRLAINTFNGGVYHGLSANDMSENDLDFSQKHLRILSGLYGILRPYDKMQPYRLEMKSRLANPNGTNLYAYWKEKLSNHINKELESQSTKMIINLCSKEYSTVLQPKIITGEMINFEFKQYANGILKTIAYSSKKARGLMARYIIQNRIQSPEKIKDFSSEGYQYDTTHSSPLLYCFIKK